MKAPLVARRRRSFVATAVVVVVVAGPVCYLATRRLGLGPTGFQPVDLIVVPWVGLGVLTAVRLFTQHRRPGRVRVLPLRLQRRIGRLVEMSEFGVGGMGDWTITAPDHTLQRVTAPVGYTDHDQPNPGGDPAAVLVGGPASASGVSAEFGTLGALSTRRPPAAMAKAGVGALDAAWTGPTDIHTVERGDTWWNLAERTLGDGRRWRVLVEVNRDREVAPGITVTDESVLRRGWQILLPRGVEENDN